MPLKLKQGTKLAFTIEQLEDGTLVFEQALRVGSQEVPRGKGWRVRTEEELWRRWLEFGDEQLARVGLEKTKR